MTIEQTSTKDKSPRHRGAHATAAASADGPPPVLAPEQAGAVAEVHDTRDIEADRITPCGLNVPHREPDAELVESIKDRGNIEPVIVRPIPAATVTEADGRRREVEFELVIGERRWKATRIAGRKFIYAEVRILTDQEALELQYEENVQRQQLSPLQEAYAFDAFRVRFNRTAAEIATRVHKSERYVTQRLTLLALPGPAQEALERGSIALGTALEIACLGEADRATAFEMVSRRDGTALSVATARDIITTKFYLRIHAAKFDVADAQLVPEAGACTTCPKRTGNQLALAIDGLDTDDRCADRPCWDKKSNAVWNQRKAAAEAAGVRVLDVQAEGKEGDKARGVARAPWKAGLVNLDAPCREVPDAAELAFEAADEALDAAERSGDEAAIEAAEKVFQEAEKATTGARAPTWRELLGDAAKPAALVRDVGFTGNVEVLELVDERAALEVLAQAGHKLDPETVKRLAEPAKARATLDAAAGDEASTEPAAWDIEARARLLLQGRLTELLVGIAEKTPPRPGLGFWRGLILGALKVGGYGCEEGLEDLVKRHGWAFDPMEQEPGDVIRGKLAELTEAKLKGLLVEVMCAEPTTADDLAKHFEIDAKPLKAAATKQAKTALRAEAAAKKAAPASKKKRGARAAATETEGATS